MTSMTALAKAPMDPSSFLSWVEGREGRYELVNGEVRMMTGGSFAHAAIATRMSAALINSLDPAAFNVTTADFGVIIGEHVRYPDIVVDRIGAHGRDLSAKNPVVIVEVLSPSSVYLDMHEKAAEYQSLPSLEAYIVASQDEPRLWVWQRGPNGWPSKPEVVEGREAVLSLRALRVDIRLAGIYRGIGPEGDGLTQDPRS